MSNFTIIHHDSRLRMGLSCNEYCMGDLIKRLSSNGSGGWCFASRIRLGEMMGFTKQTVITIVSSLVKLGLIEVHPDTKDLRVTQLWENFTGQESYLNGKESLPKRVKNYPTGPRENGKDSLPPRQDSLPPRQDSLPHTGKDSLPPSYKEISLEGELKETLEVLLADVEKIDAAGNLKNSDSEEEKKDPKKVAQKKPPKPEDEYTLVHRIRLRLEILDPDMRWSPKHSKNASELMAQMKKVYKNANSQQEPTDEIMLERFEKLIQNLPPWASVWTISTLNSNYEKIRKDAKANPHGNNKPVNRGSNTTLRPTSYGGTFRGGDEEVPDLGR